MTLIGMTREELEERRKCFERQDLIIVNANGRRSVAAFPTAYTELTYTAEQDFFITAASISLTLTAGARLHMGWSKRIDPFAGLPAIGNYSDPSVFASVICQTGGSVTEYYDYSPYGIYVYKGQSIYLESKINSGVAMDWQYNCCLFITPIIY